jgi:hypothetical protein
VRGHLHMQLAVRPQRRSVAQASGVEH